MITSFSGAHPYRPQCVAVALAELYAEWPEYMALTEERRAKLDLPNSRAVEITESIDNGDCPRCTGPLTTGPAGSRVTSCRCIPICPACGDREAFPYGTYTGITMWGSDELLEADEDADTRKQNEPAPTPAFIAATDDGPVLMSSDGVTNIELREHPGGWAEFGYDEDQDQAEHSS